MGTPEYTTTRAPPQHPGIGISAGRTAPLST
jgi:hypothetical protein